MIQTPEDVLAFWLGAPATCPSEALAKVTRWFHGGAVLDRAVSARFAATVDAALRGALDGWAATARGRVALVIVLDQFTRNVLRDDPRMYAGDAKAQRLALDAFGRGMDEPLRFEERFFLSLPLLHAEDPTMHARLRDIAARLAAQAPSIYGDIVRMYGEQVAKYHEVVSRFGRFPHRNALLGRPSTPEEEAFLVDWAEKAPPQGTPRP